MLASVPVLVLLPIAVRVLLLPDLRPVVRRGGAVWIMFTPPGFIGGGPSAAGAATVRTKFAEGAWGRVHATLHLSEAERMAKFIVENLDVIHYLE